MNRWLTWGALLALAAAGCDKASETGAKPDTAAAAAPAKASASAAAKATAEPAAPPSLPVYAEKTVPAGEGSKGIWTQAFGVVRNQGDQAKSYLDAYDLCIDSGKALCGEAQWERACEQDAALGKLETWTGA